MFLNPSYPQQVAVITGAARGLGFSLSKCCLERGMAVVMADIDEHTLHERVLELSPYQDSLMAFGCDVSQPRSLKDLAKMSMQRFKRIDWLFNNAGISLPLLPLWALSFDAIQKIIAVNLESVILSIQTFLPLLFKQEHRSRIINISSVYGLCSGSLVGPYAMTKHAILALSESLYFDLHRLAKPVDVSIACPSFFNTELPIRSLPEDGQKNHRFKALLEKSRTPDEVASIILEQIEKDQFYIFPDREVKDYSEQRIQAILSGDKPYPHSLEKIISSLA